MISPHTAEAIRLLEVAATEARDRGELPDFLAQVERIRVQVLVARTSDRSTKAESGDRLLTARATAEKIGMSIWWVRDNKDVLPIVRLSTGRYRFSERGLEKWIQRRASQ